MNKLLRTLITFIFCMLSPIFSIEATEPEEYVHVIIEEENVESANTEGEQLPFVLAGFDFDIETKLDEKLEELEKEPLCSDEEIELIALVTMAEAEGESEEGKRLVIDTILNRVESEQFPDTIHEVVYQPNQFSSMWNGRVDRCYVMDDICQLVREEAEQRKNDDVVFFTAGKYSRYGQPLFKVGNHYFSSQG